MTKLKSNAKFITLEGIEGAGKSTAVAFIQHFFATRNLPLRCVREPGGTFLAELIRNQLLKPDYEEPLTDLAELLLMFAARSQNVTHNIQPALAAGTWVLCDRFVDASYAYQGGGRGLSQEWISTLDQWLGPVSPDLTLVLDLSVLDSRKRLIERDEHSDRFEQEGNDFFERVRAVYLARAHAAPERYTVIDASQTLKAVETDIEKALQKLIEDGV